jgi:carboxyl-terminal processing protease
MRSIPLALLISAGICCGQAPSPPDPDDAAYRAIERYIQVLESVRKEHPDANKVAYDRLVNHSLEGMLSSLDPFSMFIHPEMAAGMADGKIDPHVASLGLSLGVRDDGPYLAGIDTHGPAASAGLLAGSAVLKINDAEVKDVAWQELLDRLNRQPGETTKLLVKSVDAPKPKEITVTHITVETRSLAESKLLESDKTIGYLRLAQFGGGCAKEVEAALDDLEDQGMKSLIFDLRGNPGGNLDETVTILGLFLPPATPVVTTKGREGVIGEPLKTPDRQRRKREYPITVLIDRMSASASELTAGCLQDLKRATVIGEVSYGKG